MGRFWSRVSLGVAGSHIVRGQKLVSWRRECGWRSNGPPCHRPTQALGSKPEALTAAASTLCHRMDPASDESDPAIIQGLLLTKTLLGLGVWSGWIDHWPAVARQGRHLRMCWQRQRMMIVTSFVVGFGLRIFLRGHRFEGTFPSENYVLGSTRQTGARRFKKIA